MKAVIQRVKNASVSFDGIKNEIGNGIVVLVGIGRGDTDDDARWVADKILNLRIFSDGAGKFDDSVLDIRGDILVVSQFTLYGNCCRGRRPDFTEAETPQKALELYLKFVEYLKSSCLIVKEGKFAATMLLEIHNDGPVTIIIERKSDL
ncbi:MAG: D-tyrosyl-tRNA(Tyr) deacylase [Elusimicrobia bacterium ADurb.Bin231]|nr:MAG: D-tyrosyl-tRNA(Tyr) deacylase [Elusimicrobia bacterium ADurb.Bin231]